jgi:hypothetical protein
VGRGAKATVGNERDTDLATLAFLVRFASADRHHEPARVIPEIRDIERGGFGAAQRAGERQQQQRAVALAFQPRAASVGVASIFCLEKLCSIRDSYRTQLRREEQDGGRNSAQRWGRRSVGASGPRVRLGGTGNLDFDNQKPRRYLKIPFRVVSSRRQWRRPPDVACVLTRIGRVFAL